MKRFIRQIERAFRHALVYPTLRLILNNPEVHKPLDIRKVRKILILRYDRIGDIIVTTPIFQILKKANPDLFLGVLGSESNGELVKFNPYVDRIHTLYSSWRALWKEIRAARDVRYDVVLNLIFNRTTSGGVLANLIAPDGIKVGQGDEKYRFYFNILLKLQRGGRHMAEILVSIVEEVFGLKVGKKDIQFEIAVDRHSDDKVREFVGHFGKNRRGFVVVNISASDEIRRISPEQASVIIRSVLDFSACRAVVISAPHDVELRDDLVKAAVSERCSAYPDGRVASMLEIAALISQARAVVSPDTSIVHVASAMKTPVIGFFTPMQVTAEWLPYEVTQRTIVAAPGTPVSAIPASTIEREVSSFLKKVTKK